MSGMPWLRRRREAAIVTAQVKDGEIVKESEEQDEIQMIAEEMIQAIEKKDAKKLAEALRASFQMMELEPHEEIEHEEQEQD